MKVPKPITALKALLLGADIKLPDGYTYRYSKGDEKQSPHFCIVAQMSNELGNYEECTVGSDLSLQQFIQLCEQMTEEQWVAICATNALVMERLERQEKRERRLQPSSKMCHDAHTFGCDPACPVREQCLYWQQMQCVSSPMEKTFSTDFGPSPMENVLTTKTALQRMAKTVEDMALSHVMPLVPKDQVPCKFDIDGQCEHKDRLQNMPCHRQNCPWPERQTGLGSDIWWKGRTGDWEQKKP